MSEKIAMVVLWRGGELIMEERWIDMDGGEQDTRYAFAGGTVEADETEAEAAVREILEEAGITIDPDSLDGPNEYIHRDQKGYVFTKLLPITTVVKEGSIVIWTPQDLLEHRRKGKLMPFTEQHADKEIFDINGLIDN